MNKLKSFYVNSLRECLYIVSDKNSKCVIIDPGCYTDSEKSRVEEYISKEGLLPEAIFLTHAHFDHVFALNYFAKKWNIPVYMHQNDFPLLDLAEAYCRVFNYQFDKPVNLRYIFVEDSQAINIGDLKFVVLHTPGHSSGGVCYMEEKEKLLFTGDTLFCGSVGRSDFEGSNPVSLEKSLARLSQLDGDLKVYPGHGVSTTIRQECIQNPYL
ncbi:MAG: MBL fold metallo-hydrolase [Bacteroidales bacterium]|jgi:hydroxyacylglutathione hydrolase|nr:MBL fold metallo-hydrolase [Bacteroidales bacterium]